MSGTNVWKYIGIAGMVAGALFCVSYVYNNGDVEIENKNFMALQQALMNMQEKMVASEQKASDLAKVINEMKGKVDAPVRVVEKQVFILCFYGYFYLLLMKLFVGASIYLKNLRPAYGVGNTRNYYSFLLIGYCHPGTNT